MKKNKLFLKTQCAKVEFSIKDREGESVVDLLLQDKEFPEEVEEGIQMSERGCFYT